MSTKATRLSTTARAAHPFLTVTKSLTKLDKVSTTIPPCTSSDNPFPKWTIPTRDLRSTDRHLTNNHPKDSRQSFHSRQSRAIAFPDQWLLPNRRRLITLHSRIDHSSLDLCPIIQCLENGLSLPPRQTWDFCPKATSETKTTTAETQIATMMLTFSSSCQLNQSKPIL